MDVVVYPNENQIKVEFKNKISLKTFIKDLTVTSKYADFIKDCEVDIKAVGSINELNVQNGDYNLEFGEIIPDEE